MTGERIRCWWWVALAVLGLGVASLLSNITTEAQLSGEDQGLFAVRRTLSLLLNAGTAWAGISVLAGWLVRGRLAASLAGLLAGPSALVVHYGLGELTGAMPAGSFASNGSWFVIAAVTGAPLGLLGATARAVSVGGLLAGLVVPAGAVLEPWVAGWWLSGALQSEAERTSGLVAALVITVAGLAGAWFVAVGWSHSRPA